MTNKKKNLDPFYEREKKKYKQPIPSREYILSILKVKDVPCSFNYLVRELGLHVSDENKGLSYRMKAMLRDGQIKEKQGYYCLVDFQTRKCRGYVQFSHDSDEIFLVSKNKSHPLSYIYRKKLFDRDYICLLYTSPSPRD